MAAPHDAAGVDPDALTLHQAADLLGVHYMTAYRYVRLGLLPAEKVGASWRVRQQDVEELASRGQDERPGRGRQPAPWAERFEHRLRAGDEPGAWGVIESALASGADPSDLYMDVVVPALRSIGDAWARGEIDVAVEHRGSVIAMRLIGRLAPRFLRRGRSRGAVVVGAPPGDHHGLPSALLSDLLRGAGFEVVDLGADVPVGSFVLAARAVDRLQAVAISVTTPGNEEAVAATVRALHDELGPDLRVLVGGGAVPREDDALALGADGWAADAPGAVALLGRRDEG